MVLPMVAAAQPIFELADLDPGTAQLISFILAPVINIYIILFLIRTVISWVPEIKDDQWPYSLAYYPTEFLQAPVRKIVGTVNGVDVSPIVWLAILTFVNEILLGNQGLLVLLSEKRVV
eukprot:jgi/Mesvir1/16116/Mv08401-RA.1